MIYVGYHCFTYHGPWTSQPWVPGLPPNERVKKLRMEVHENTVRLWEKAKKSRDEIVGEKALPLSAC